jgi:protein subunit release factor B
VAESVRFGEFGEITPAKVEDLRLKIQRLGLDLSKVEERFTKGSGPGGQKINKTNNRVVLRYGGLVVKCQRERKRSLNRFIALRELADRLERMTR